MNEFVENKKKEMKCEKDKNQIYSDFDLVRDVQYKYSKRAQESFFAKPIENYFFIKYALSKKGLLFLENKPVAKEDSMKSEKLIKHTNDLKDEGI